MIAPIAGRMIEPNGSMCGIGFSVRRPASLRGAVTEPERDDTVADLVEDDRDDQTPEVDDRLFVDVHAGARVGRAQRRCDAHSMQSRAAGIASSRASGSRW